MTTDVQFTQVSHNEIKFEFKGYKFLLVENNRGVFGSGRAVQLYQLEGLKKEHIKEIAWTKSDNHGGFHKSDAYDNTKLHTMGSCQKLAIEYLNKVL